jgi:hypothetical protein
LGIARKIRHFPRHIRKRWEYGIGIYNWRVGDVKDQYADLTPVNEDLFNEDNEAGDVYYYICIYYI